MTVGLAIVEESSCASEEGLCQEEQNANLSLSQVSLFRLLLGQLDLFLHRAQSAPPVANGERIVREAERIFAENLAQPLSVKNVAARVGVAPSVLRAHFATFRGCAPSQAQMRLRLRLGHAMALLQNSDLSLKEVAYSYGFHSSSHLSRHVQAATGQSPGRWRRK